VEPLPIESKLLESPLIDQCMVVGQDQKQLGVLVVPSLAGFAAAGIEKTELSAINARTETHGMLRAEFGWLVGFSTGFKPFERIAVSRFWTSPSGSVRS